MAIGRLDPSAIYSNRDAESESELKAQTVEKGRLEIDAYKKATADEETMRKGLADIYSEKPKTDTPEPPKATEPGGYETPEMKAEGVQQQQRQNQTDQQAAQAPQQQQQGQQQQQPTQQNQQAQQA